MIGPYTPVRVKPSLRFLMMIWCVLAFDCDATVASPTRVGGHVVAPRMIEHVWPVASVSAATVTTAGLGTLKSAEVTDSIMRPVAAEGAVVIEMVAVALRVDDFVSATVTVGEPVAVQLIRKVWLPESAAANVYVPSVAAPGPTIAVESEEEILVWF